jgi:general secretion pathway protein G
MRYAKKGVVMSYKNYKKCFTLIELMLVVIIIGVLAAMVVPRLVGRSEQARVAAAKADIDAKMDVGHYPNDLKELRTDPGVAGWKGPYLKKDPKDPWGRDYDYKLESETGKDYKLCSKGPSEANSEDDICNQ